MGGDPDGHAESEQKLKNPIAEISGVTDWNIDSGGRITIEYKPEETSSNVAEEALAGIVYRIEHISDSQRLGKADKPNLGVTEEPEGGMKNGIESNVETIQRTRRTEQKG